MALKSTEWHYKSYFPQAADLKGAGTTDVVHSALMLRVYFLGALR